MLMSLVRHMTMLSEGEPTYKPLQSQAFSEGKKKPLYLSHGWCYSNYYGSYIILNASRLVLIVVLV